MINQYIVVYLNGNDLKTSPIIDDYEDAQKFCSSENGANDNKAIIVKIEKMCIVQPSQISIEYV